MNMRLCAALLAAAWLAFPLRAAAQEPAKPAAKPAPKAAVKGEAKAAAKGEAAATVNGVAIPQARLDTMVRMHMARGQRESDQLRAAVRDDLINREVVYQEASKVGFARRPEVQNQLDLARQEIVVNAYLSDYMLKNPVTDADLQKEYEAAKARTGDREFRARHILVETEDEAKTLIAELKKGGKFEDLAAKSSKDEGSKARGGDLDWNTAAVYDKAFGDALLKLQKGQVTEAPVRTRFGFHVIRLDDVRPIKFPTFEEAKPRLQQQAVQRKVEDVVRNLRAKAKVE